MITLVCTLLLLITHKGGGRNKLYVAMSPKDCETARRSTRVRAEIPLRLSNVDPELLFSEHCRTLLVNTQGAGVKLTRALQAGLRVQLDELPSGAVAFATVVNSVPIGGDGKGWMVGLALDAPGNIWGLKPAPADWAAKATKPGTASKGTVSKAPAQKGEWPYSVFSDRGEAHPGRK